jgi:predicted glycosyltransferase
VLDEPARVRRAWGKLANERAICDYYDAVWVYGDPAVYDPVREYRFSREVAAKVRYTGYLDQRMRLQLVQPTDNSGGSGEELGDGPDPVAALVSQPGRLVLCLVGGGQDGASLAEAFAEVELPPETIGVILTGPFMPPEIQQRLRRRLSGDRRFRVLEFIREPTRLLTRADRVIAMGGYNTVCEVLSLEKRALIIPRVYPDQEQWIRAVRLRTLGLLDVLHPDEVTPRALTEWLAREMGPPPRVRERIDFDGLTRLPRLLSELLAGSAATGGRKIEEIQHVAD